ncbi:MAG TPA: hypothetical protein VFQ27_01575 [Xanthobacteraceae bacterium]|nr:hypothetical protein [Xanthobacteraceae bacterium]
MRRGVLVGGLFAAIVTFGFGMGSAGAFVADGHLSRLGGTKPIPVAMCGHRCAGGGRYIPGPPAVCREHGLRYCGPSRGPTVVSPIPGVGVVIDRPRRREHCRTVTVRRPNGTVRTTTECR